MSSIRNEKLALSKQELEQLDHFMLSLGCTMMVFWDSPHHDKLDMPWSQRWYRDNTVTYTDQEKATGRLYICIDTARWLYKDFSELVKK